MYRSEPFIGPLKPSMKRRSDYNDYEGRRMYKVTLAVEGRPPLLGQVISPSISSEEKCIMRATFAEKARVVIVKENGFTDYYKPSRRFFNACQAGSLLLSRLGSTITTSESLRAGSVSTSMKSPNCYAKMRFLSDCSWKESVLTDGYQAYSATVKSSCFFSKSALAT